jgi:hypothetical protein
MIQQQYKSNITDISGEVQTTNFGLEVSESLFQMLTSNVYNDPKLAVIREWSTNACDACIAAGKEVKFDVHLPTLEEPMFSVRDYGTGLAPEDIVGLFSSLGASTKRDSNDYNGALGIGRLAGLAVSDAFTVESFYNGGRHSYVISMQKGIPVTIYMGSTPTNKPNGLCLSVTVNTEDINKYKNRAEYLYKFFDHKPTLNLEGVNVHFDVKEHISDDWFIQNTGNPYSRTNYAVMAQVPYAIPDSSEVNNQGFRNLVIKAPTGSVSFNPGRESLSLDDSTVTFLNEQFKKIADDYTQAAMLAMANTTSDKELVDTFSRIRGNAPSNIKDNLDLSSFASDYYKKLFTKPSPFTTGSSTFMHVSVTDTFVQDTNNLLNISYKGASYSTSYVLDIYHRLGYKAFFNSEHVIVDLKTKFKTALYEHYKNKSLVTWHRVGKSNMDDVVAEATRYLKGMGIPFKKASELIDEKSVKTTPIREGFYASSLHGATMAKTEKMKEDAIKNNKYLCLKMNNMTPDIPEDSGHAYEDYIAAYRLLSATDPTTPVVKGVSKKYQAYVEDLDNWTDFCTYIEDTMKNSTFKVPSEDINPSLSGMMIGPTNYMNYPTDIQEYYKECRNRTLFNTEKGYIYPAQCLNSIERFGATTVSYEWNKDITPDTLQKKYSHSWPILTGTTANYTRLQPDIVERLATLEEFYEIHSSEQ